MSAMFGSFDFDVIRRSFGYLIYEGMTFTIMLTALAANLRAALTRWHNTAAEVDW